ncbi:MAG: hypothetical protein JW900_03455, partial [Anaerolineae bacterium]|nr:hypothetical protein [Anaerolineae bacterium]
SHPLTEAHLAQLERLVGQAPIVWDVPVQINHRLSLAGQIVDIVDSVGLSPHAWQTTALLINPPGYAPVAAALMAELHGRIGHFPTIVRVRPVPDSTPPQFEIAELINLQALRDEARLRRSPNE